MTEDECLVGAGGGDNHLPLLWFSLELTKDSKLPVGEFGSGGGSTPYLRQYCKDDGREFYTYENNKVWGEKWGSTFVSSWLEQDLYRKSSVVLIDQGPAEDRHISIGMLVDKAVIIVVHDVEPENANSYMLHLIWHLFKYRILVKGPKIWTAALSNHIDLTRYDQTLIGNYKIEI